MVTKLQATHYTSFFDNFKHFNYFEDQYKDLESFYSSIKKIIRSSEALWLLFLNERQMNPLDTTKKSMNLKAHMVLKTCLYRPKLDVLGPCFEEQQIISKDPANTKENL